MPRVWLKIICVEFLLILKYLTVTTYVSLKALVAEAVGSFDAMDLFRHTTELAMHVSIADRYLMFSLSIYIT